MTDEETAEALSKVMMKSQMELIKVVLEQRNYQLVLELLTKIKPRLKDDR